MDVWKMLGVGAMAIAGAVSAKGEALPADAWNETEILFSEGHRGRSYRLDAPTNATAVRFDAPATLFGETLTLDAPARVAGSGTLLNPLAGVDGLRVATSEVSAVFPQAESATLWKDARLRDGMAITGEICGGMIGHGRLCPTEMFFFEKTGDTATAQFHCYDDVKADGSAKYVKAFKLQFDQTGDDVAVKVLWARYADAAFYGTDLETTYQGVYSTPYTSSLTDPVKAIGITNLRIVDDVVLSGTFPAGTVEIAMRNVTIHPQRPVTIANEIAGFAEELRFESDGADWTQWTHPDFVTTEERKILENTCIDTLSFVSARTSGGWVNNKDGDDPALYGSFVRRSPETNVVYVQYFDRKKNSDNDSDYTKTVVLQFRQDGGDVWMKALGTCYSGGDWLNKDQGGAQLRDSVSTAAFEDGYGIHDVVFAYRPGVWPIALAGANTNSLPRGTRVVMDGVDVSIAGRNMLPAGHDLVLTNGASVVVDAGSGGLAFGNTFSNTISLFAGSSYTVKAPWNVGNLTEMTLDASTFEATYQSREGCSCQYVERLTMRNGARTKGWPIRVGWHQVESFTRSEGTGPNVIENGVMAARRDWDGQRQIPNEHVFDVETDLHVLGPLMDVPNFDGIVWVKTGAARLVLAGADGDTDSPFRVDEGTLELAANGVFANETNDVDVVLAGGALDAGAFTNSLGALTVTADSALRVAGGVAEFADSSACQWSEDAVLSVTGGERRLRPGHVRFARADGGAGLSVAQLNAIRYNDGQKVDLDADGWLVSRPTCTVILIR